MRILYVYYTRTQRTESSVLKLKKAMGGDERIVHVKPAVGYGGPFGFIRAIAGVFGKKMVKLQESDPVNLGDYDRVVIATPMWASQVPPPIRTFLTQHRGAKSTAYLVTHSGASPDKMFDELDKLTGCKRVAAMALDGMKGDADLEIKTFAEQISR